MITIVGISGSLRRGSFNSMLLRAAGESMPEGAVLEMASLADFPLYNADLEAESGIPAAVAALKEKLAAADGLLIATPEYNHAMPGVLKNAMDWLSRPAREIPRVFGALPVAQIGASPGRGGTALAQASLLPVLATLGTRPWSSRSLYVAGATKLFDDKGLTDEETRTRLARLVADFVSAVRSGGPRRGT